jgi:hypothetical protein
VLPDCALPAAKHEPDSFSHSKQRVRVWQVARVPTASTTRCTAFSDASKYGLTNDDAVLTGNEAVAAKNGNEQHYQQRHETQSNSRPHHLAKPDHIGKKKLR